MFLFHSLCLNFIVQQLFKKENNCLGFPPQSSKFVWSSLIGANDGQMKILTTLAPIEPTHTIMEDQVGNPAACKYLSDFLLVFCVNLQNLAALRSL